MVGQNSDQTSNINQSVLPRGNHPTHTLSDQIGDSKHMRTRKQSREATLVSMCRPNTNYLDADRGGRCNIILLLIISLLLLSIDRLPLY